MARARLAVVAVRGRGRRRRENMRQHDHNELRRPSGVVAQLHRHQRSPADHPVGHHQVHGLRGHVPAARDHRVHGRVPRHRALQLGQDVPEPDADPRRPHVHVPRTVTDDPRQPGPQGDRILPVDQHHPGLGHYFQKSQ